MHLFILSVLYRYSDASFVLHISSDKGASLKEKGYKFLLRRYLYYGVLRPC